MTRVMIRNAAMIVAALTLPVLASADTRAILTGRTDVSLDAGFLSALGTLGVTPSVNRPATLTGTVASFPVVAGEIDLTTAKWEIFHSGGITLTAGSTAVTLLNFLIDTSGTAPVLTGALIVNGTLAGRAPLFDLALPALSLPLQPGAKGVLRITKIGVTLTSEAAQALNGAFGVTAFAKGFLIGQAETGDFVSPGKQ